MHIPCPDCSTGWVMPEDGHSHLRPCPTCHGHAYISAFKGSDEADSSEHQRNSEEGSIGFSAQTLSPETA